jgi:hypothetical protein
MSKATVDNIRMSWGANTEFHPRTGALVRITEALDGAAEFVPWCVTPLAFEISIEDDCVDIIAHNTAFLHDYGDESLPMFSEYGLDFLHVLKWEQKRLRKMYSALAEVIGAFVPGKDIGSCSLTIPKTNDAIGLRMGKTSLSSHMRAFWVHV